jgi:hypothetical protein
MQARGAEERPQASERDGTRLSPDLFRVKAVGVQLREGLAQRQRARRGMQRGVQRLAVARGCAGVQRRQTVANGSGRVTHNNARVGGRRRVKVGGVRGARLRRIARRGGHRRRVGQQRVGRGQESVQRLQALRARTRESGSVSAAARSACGERVLCAARCAVRARRARGTRSVLLPACRCARACSAASSNSGAAGPAMPGVAAG